MPRRRRVDLAGEFSPESYLSIAADLDMQIDELREEIAEFESVRANLK